MFYDLNISINLFSQFKFNLKPFNLFNGLKAHLKIFFNKTKNHNSVENNIKL